MLPWLTRPSWGLRRTLQCPKSAREWGRSKAAVNNGPPAAGATVVTAQVRGYSMQGRVTRAISPL